MPADLVGELLALGGLDAERASSSSRWPACCAPSTRGGVRPGDSTAGRRLPARSGLLAIAAAHARGVEAVWAREPRPERLERALALGAERHGNELVDVVVVCTPKPDAIARRLRRASRRAARCASTRRRSPAHALGLDGHALYVGEVDVCASYSAGPGDMRAALRAHRRRPASIRCPSSPTASGLDETGRALELARSGEAIKALVLP